MTDDVNKSEFRKVKAKATIELIEYSDGTVECIPKFEPPMDLTLGSHAMISAMYQDMNNYLKQSSQPEGEANEESNKSSNTD